MRFHNYNLAEKVNEDKLYFKIIKKFWDLKSLIRLYSPDNLVMSENTLPFDLYRKIKRLYSSILDASSVMLKYKSSLSAPNCMEDVCITPLSASSKLPMLFYKREDLTSIKAYKVRGALYQMNRILNRVGNDNVEFVAASTGNHALGVLKAAEILNVSDITVCISKCVTDAKKQKLEKRVDELVEKGINAKLLVSGDCFDDTNKFAKQITNNSNIFYIDPYNNQSAVAGQGTIGIELLAQLENNLLECSKLKEITFVVPIGGGGLISGVSCALKSGVMSYPRLRKLKLNVVGVKLDDLESKYGDAIKVSHPGEQNYDYINYFVDEQFCINDSDMEKGIKFVQQDLGTKVEGAAAGTLKPILDNTIVPSESNAVVCLLSGAN